jgi:hypothetical protein
MNPALICVVNTLLRTVAFCGCGRRTLTAPFHLQARHERNPLIDCLPQKPLTRRNIPAPPGFSPAMLTRSLVLLLVLVAPLRAEPTVSTDDSAPVAETTSSFIGQLTAEDRARAGLDGLTTEQQAALETQVERELRLARSGDTIAFAGTFSTRRPPSEYASAGLETLTQAQRDHLDGLVARAISQRPALAYSFRQPASGSAVTETVTSRAQWRGAFTATYGRGSGGTEFYGGSVTTIYDDPDRGFAAALTLEQYRGTGYRWGVPGDRYPYGYGVRPNTWDGWRR